MKDYFVHETAIIDEGATIGKGTKIWHFSHIMSNCRIGENCNIGQNVVISPVYKLVAQELAYKKVCAPEELSSNE